MDSMDSTARCCYWTRSTRPDTKDVSRRGWTCGLCTKQCREWKRACMRSSTGDVTSVGVPKEHGRDSRDELTELKVKSAQRTARGPITGGCTERKAAAYADEGECIHDCTATDDPESVLGMSRQNNTQNSQQWSPESTYRELVVWKETWIGLWERSRERRER
ncbi:hypothetical protein BDV93DRAFT_512182 [Ceratobasidium sp. AG-I]|nr:hypothetical protein BDV93DRAFT_512182 [Ceratobasidium sp. AG-I]